MARKAQTNQTAPTMTETMLQKISIYQLVYKNYKVRYKGKKKLMQLQSFNLFLGIIFSLNCSLFDLSGKKPSESVSHFPAIDLQEST